MPETPILWVGMAALAAMFLLSLLSDWLFEGRSSGWSHPRVSPGQ
ncbi:MAG TPA: hypothetical protein VFA45_03215 [Actinomycetes bacterium]|jgi:hypothetical protein|nr:hypothetical protein [Actinomycetes bacterium]